MPPSTRTLDALTAIRASIGVANYLTPGLVSWTLGFGSRPPTELRYVCRIWAARNLAFAAATRVSEGEARRGWLRANVAIDVLDALSGLGLVHRRGRLVPEAPVAVLLPAAAAGLGLSALRSC